MALIGFSLAGMCVKRPPKQKRQSDTMSLLTCTLDNNVDAIKTNHQSMTQHQVQLAEAVPQPTTPNRRQPLQRCKENHHGFTTSFTDNNNHAIDGLISTLENHIYSCSITPKRTTLPSSPANCSPCFSYSSSNTATTHRHAERRERSWATLSKSRSNYPPIPQRTPWIWPNQPCFYGRVYAPLWDRMSQELYGRTFSNRIKPSLRNYLMDFASTDADRLTTESVPFCLDFSKRNPTKLAHANESGVVSITDTSPHDDETSDEDHPPGQELPKHLRPLHQWQAHENAIFDVAWTGDDYILTASGDQTAALWHPELPRMAICTLQGHLGSVKTIAQKPDELDVFATAGRDGNLMLWDKRCTGTRFNLDYYQKPIDVIQHAHSRVSTPMKTAALPTVRNQSEGVTCAKFLRCSSGHYLASTGAADGLVKLWDLRFRTSNNKFSPTPVATSHPSTAFKRPHALISMTLDPTHTRLFALCHNSVVYEYNALSLGPAVRKFSSSGLDASSFYLKMTMSPDGTFLACGSKDDRIHVWEVDAVSSSASRQPSPIVLSGHANEVSGIAWSENMNVLASCSDDCTVRVWRRSDKLTFKHRPGSDDVDDADRAKVKTQTIGHAESGDFVPFKISPRKSSRPAKRPSSALQTTHISPAPLTSVSPRSLNTTPSARPTSASPFSAGPSSKRRTLLDYYSKR